MKKIKNRNSKTKTCQLNQVPGMVNAGLNRFYEGVNFAGLALIILMQFAPDYLESHGCENKNLLDDVGKTLFASALLVHVGMTPVAKRLAKSIFGENAEKVVNRVSLIFNEWMDGIETGVFVLGTANAFELNPWLSWALVTPAIWPAVMSTLHAANPRIVRGAYQDLSEMTDRESVKGLVSFFEAGYNSFSAASMIAFAVALLYDILYDTWHAEDAPSEAVVTKMLMYLGALFGLASVTHPTARSLMRALETGVSILYYIAMFSVSTYACLDPEAMTVEGFLEKGGFWVSVMVALSAFMGAHSATQSTENAYLKNSVKAKNGYVTVDLDELIINNNEPRIVEIKDEDDLVNLSENNYGTFKYPSPKIAEKNESASENETTDDESVSGESSIDEREKSGPRPRSNSAPF